MNSKFSIDARKICAYLCIYECLKSRILTWIRDYHLEQDKDFIVTAEEVFYMTSAAAQKIYMAYLANSPR